MSRCTKTEKADRIFKVQGWIMNRVPDYLILKQIENDWSVTSRQAKNYLSEAYKIWHDANESSIEQQRQMSIDKLMTEQRNMKAEFKGTPAGMSAILRIEKEINRLRGAYVPPKLTIQGDAENPIAVSVGEGFTPEKEKRLQELLKKAELLTKK